MSIITALSDRRSAIGTMIVKTFFVGFASAVVVASVAVYHPTPAISAVKLPPAPPAVVVPYMVVVEGIDSEPPPWPEDFTQPEKLPVVAASVPLAPAGKVLLSSSAHHPPQPTRRLIPHAVSLATSTRGPAVAILWNP